MIVATSAVERKINRRAEVSAMWSVQGVERVARPLKEVSLNGTKLEFRGQNVLVDRCVFIC